MILSSYRLPRFPDSSSLSAFDKVLNWTTYSKGLCAYLLSNVPDAAARGIVLGHDHRHNSEHWAYLTAANFLANNVKVYLYDGMVHTPLCVNFLPLIVRMTVRAYIGYRLV
jgi:Phosphoglucomutase/phosphomannomutase, alpha/beta/alpha domain I